MSGRCRARSHPRRTRATDEALWLSRWGCTASSPTLLSPQDREVYHAMRRSLDFEAGSSVRSLRRPCTSRNMPGQSIYADSRRERRRAQSGPTGPAPRWWRCLQRVRGAHVRGYEPCHACPPAFAARHGQQRWSDLLRAKAAVTGRSQSGHGLQAFPAISGILAPGSGCAPTTGHAWEDDLAARAL